MSKLLTRVEKTKEKRNIITEKTYALPMWEFIMECYDSCTPNMYGNAFPKKIVYDMDDKIRELSPKLDRGDLHINYELYLEAKISYKNKDGKYSLTNLRVWQNLDYYILCFVDTEKKFTPYFYCVPSDIIFNNPYIHHTGMNNTMSVNSHNMYVATRTSIKSEDLNWLFKKHSVLKGTTYKHLISFLNSQYKQLKK
jgi:hypothetical protein